MTRYHPSVRTWHHVHITTRWPFLRSGAWSRRTYLASECAWTLLDEERCIGAWVHQIPCDPHEHLCLSAGHSADALVMRAICAFDARCGSFPPRWTPVRFRRLYLLTSAASHILPLGATWGAVGRRYEVYRKEEEYRRMPSSRTPALYLVARHGRHLQRPHPAESSNARVHPCEPTGRSGLAWVADAQNIFRARTRSMACVSTDVP
jgi:hypothetical protein